MIAKVAILCAIFAAAHAAGVFATPKVSMGISRSSRQQDAIGNYDFGYDIVDGLGATNSRVEVGDAHGNKKGTYALTDIDGRARRVDYVADGLGFRASINTNEPGTALSAPANTAITSPYAMPVAPVDPGHAVAAPAPLAAAPLLASAAVAPAAPIVAAAAPIVSYSHSVAASGVSTSARQQDVIGNYAFNYGIVDGLGASNSRSEVGDVHGNMKGSYSIADIDGRARRVDYVADATGFRAAVNTNEPGTALSAPAAATIVSPYAMPVAPVDPGHAVAAPAPLAAAPLLASAAVAPAVAPAAPVVAAPAPIASYSHSVAAPGVSTSARQQNVIGNYAFNYGIVDGLGASNSRAEVGDAHGNKQGSYSLADIDGRARRVDYVADAAGFRAAVNTNEPGTALSAPAAATIVSPYAMPVAPVDPGHAVAAAPAPAVPIAPAVSSYSTVIGHAAPAVAPVIAAPAPVVAAAPSVSSYSTAIEHAAPAHIVAAPAPVFAAAPAVSSYSSVIGHAAPAPVFAAPAAVSSYSTVVGHGAHIGAPFGVHAAVAPASVSSYSTVVGKGSLFPARTSVGKSIHL